MDMDEVAAKTMKEIGEAFEGAPTIKLPTPAETFAAHAAIWREEADTQGDRSSMYSQNEGFYWLHREMEAQALRIAERYQAAARKAAKEGRG